MFIPPFFNESTTLILLLTIIAQNTSKLNKESRCEIVEFHKKLKELRTQAGLTQQQLGSQIGVTKSVVSYYELQERIPSPEVLIKLAAVFHVSTDYLLGIEKSSVIDVSGLKDEDIRMLEQMASYMRQKNENSSNQKSP